MELKVFGMNEQPLGRIIAMAGFGYELRHYYKEGEKWTYWKVDCCQDTEVNIHSAFNLAERKKILQERFPSAEGVFEDVIIFRTC